MPIYEYTCKSCKARFEKLVRTMAQGDSVECPECGSKKTEREMSVFAVGAEGGGKHPAPPQCSSCPNGMCGLRGE